MMIIQLGGSMFFCPGVRVCLAHFLYHKNKVNVIGWKRRYIGNDGNQLLAESGSSYLWVIWTVVKIHGELAHGALQ